MSNAIKATINLSKLDRTAFFENKTGDKMLAVVLWPSRDRKFDQDYDLKQDVGKDRKGERTPFIGTARYLQTGGGQQQQRPMPRRPVQSRGETPGSAFGATEDEDNLPF